MTDEPVTCSECGRTLRHPASVAGKIGPVCRERKEREDSLVARGLEVIAAARAGQ